MILIKIEILVKNQIRKKSFGQFSPLPLGSYVKLATSSWVDSESKFELESVMTYCSYCSATTSEPVMTTKSGVTFGSSNRMTTEDAHQIQWRYCRERTGFSFKEYVSCTSEDNFGYNRKVFVDRICDGQVDCNRLEDETGELGTCSAAQAEFKIPDVRRYTFLLILGYTGLRPKPYFDALDFSAT